MQAYSEGQPAGYGMQPQDPYNGYGSEEVPGQALKRCNCKKAKCLKLYCVCFSAGVYCSGCACRDCMNTLSHENMVMLERERILQRSPRAFAPKVEQKMTGDITHKKGCRCRKSKCLKKYCECYDAGVSCSAMCRCDDCHNRPDLGGPGGMPMAGALVAMQPNAMALNGVAAMGALGLGGLPVMAVPGLAVNAAGVLGLAQLQGLPAMGLPPLGGQEPARVLPGATLPGLPPLENSGHAVTVVATARVNKQPARRTSGAAGAAGAETSAEEADLHRGSRAGQHLGHGVLLGPEAEPADGTAAAARNPEQQPHESAHGTAANQMLLSKGMIPAPGVLSMQPQAAGFVVAASINEHVAGVGSDTAHQTADLAGAAGVEDAALLVAASTAPADAAAVVIIGAQKQERKADAQRDSGPPADVINIPADGSGHPHTSGTSVSEVAPLMPQQHHGRTGGSIGTPDHAGMLADIKPTSSLHDPPYSCSLVPLQMPTCSMGMVSMGLASSLNPSPGRDLGPDPATMATACTTEAAQQRQQQQPGSVQEGAQEGTEAPHGAGAAQFESMQVDAQQGAGTTAWPTAGRVADKVREPSPAPYAGNVGSHPTPVINNSAAAGGIVGMNQGHSNDLATLLQPSLLLSDPDLALRLAIELELDPTHQMAAHKSALILGSMLNMARTRPKFAALAHHLPAAGPGTVSELRQQPGAEEGHHHQDREAQLRPQPQQENEPPVAGTARNMVTAPHQTPISHTLAAYTGTPCNITHMPGVVGAQTAAAPGPGPSYAGRPSAFKQNSTHSSLAPSAAPYILAATAAGVAVSNACGPTTSGAGGSGAQQGSMLAGGAMRLGSGSFRFGAPAGGQGVSNGGRVSDSARGGAGAVTAEATVMAAGGAGLGGAHYSQGPGGPSSSSILQVSRGRGPSMPGGVQAPGDDQAGMDSMMLPAQQQQQQQQQAHVTASTSQRRIAYDTAMNYGHIPRPAVSGASGGGPARRAHSSARPAGSTGQHGGYPEAPAASGVQWSGRAPKRVRRELEDDAEGGQQGHEVTSHEHWPSLQPCWPSNTPLQRQNSSARSALQCSPAFRDVSAGYQGSVLPPLDTLTSIQEQEAMQALCEMGSRPASQGTPAAPITLEQRA